MLTNTGLLKISAMDPNPQVLARSESEYEKSSDSEPDTAIK
jgi:hypothetical protein